MQSKYGKIEEIVFIRDFARPYLDFKSYTNIMKKIRLEEIICEKEAKENNSNIDEIEKKNKKL